MAAVLLAGGMATSLSAQLVPHPVGEQGRTRVLDGPGPFGGTAAGAADTTWFIHPGLLIVHNTELPSFGNDGALWAGRGANLLADAGVGIRRRSESLTLSAQFRPAVVFSPNRPFFVFPGTSPGQSAFSSPWNRGAASIDLPLRFGERPITEIHLGESFAQVEWENAELGFSTANQWWGPGVRNALVLSDNAPGFAHFFVGTGTPIQTRVGAVGARVLLGSLTESRYFDRDDDNDARSINGAFLEFSPARAPALSVGLARIVIAPVPTAVDAIAHGLDFLTKWQTSPDSVGDGEPPVWRTDQVTSLFVKWAAPTMEVYAEWARTELPRSLSDLLVTPHASQGYTVGLQWSNPVGSVSTPAAVRLQ
ncbi:MAG: hypothetical protein H0X64_00820, partial [Gemmatimonadaceae bacterium]|nr:hypothetical protein [Gemmatimonadaceae bacterium]